MNRFLLLLFAFYFTIPGQAQTGDIPEGSCGLLFTYDGSGNRIKREYVCNNGGASPGGRIMNTPIDSSEKKGDPIAVATLKGEIVFENIEALYPNPTTGTFTIRFMTPVENGTVFITDVTGKVLQRVIGNGYQLHFDLSGAAAGVYYVQIKTREGKTITKKVVKQ